MWYTFNTVVEECHFLTPFFELATEKEMVIARIAKLINYYSTFMCDTLASLVKTEGAFLMRPKFTERLANVNLMAELMVDAAASTIRGFVLETNPVKAGFYSLAKAKEACKFYRP